MRTSLAALPLVPLRVTGERLDGSWLYIAVEPAQAGVRAVDHAVEMARIERQLRAAGDDEVLLVPALQD